MLELRVVCAALWFVLWLAVRRHTRGPALWWATAFCGLALAADLGRWHVALWEWTRGILRETALYESRIAFKVGIAVVLVVAAILLARLVLETARTAGRGAIGLAASAAWLIWLLAWTAFLDDVLPRVFHEPALRYGLEMSWALVPILLVLRPRETRADA